MEQRFSKGYSPSQALSNCVSDSSLLTQIQQCAQGNLGISLMHKNAVETGALQPAHQYVPWVVVNGKPNTDITEDMLSWVCSHYTGTKPAGCSSKLKAEEKRCYKYGIISK